MIRIVTIFACVVAVLVAAAQPVSARRIALVIGNEKYQPTEAEKAASRSTAASQSTRERFLDLNNPVRDAEAIAKLLEANGFAVQLHKNLIQKDFEVAISDFRELVAKGADEVLVFYAGHGMVAKQRGKEANILASVDAELDCARSEAYSAISMNDVIEAARGVPKQIFIFDACRDNPFANCKRRSGSDFSFRAAMPMASYSDSRVVIAHSTGDGGKAGDGPAGKNSPFATALLAVMEENRHAPFRELLEIVSVQVARESKDTQVPTVLGLGGSPDMCLAGKECVSIAVLTEQLKVARNTIGIAQNDLETASANLKKGQFELAVRNAHFVARVSETLLKEGRAVDAALIALEGIPDTADTYGRERPYVSKATAALTSSLSAGKVLGERAVLAHEGSVNEVAFSPDGRRIVTASDDTTARVWDASGREVAVLRGHESGVRTVIFSPVGDRLVTLSNDKTARLWSGDGNELAVLRGHENWVRSATFSPDDRHILTTSNLNPARVWDINGKEIAVLREYEGKIINSVAFSPDGLHFVIASEESAARVYRFDGKKVAVLTGHTESINFAIFNSDGGRIVTASSDRTARLWNAQGQQLFILTGHEAPVVSASFGPDGRIVTASSDHTARLWGGDGRAIAVLRGHVGEVKTATFSPDGRRIITVSDDNSARVWDADGKELSVIRGQGAELFRRGWGDKPVTFSPDSQRIVATSAEGTPRVLTGDGKELFILNGHLSPVTRASFSPDGRRIITASDDNTARLWDAESDNIVILRSHDAAVNTAAISPDRRLAVTGSEDNTARIWDAAGRDIAVLRGHEGPVWSAQFSPDGRRLATLARGDAVRLWGADGQEVAVLRGHMEWVNSVAFSPDGRRIVTASNDKTARLWDVDGRNIGVLSGHREKVNMARVSNDGRYIVTASSDGTARVWDINGREVAALVGHTGDVTDVELSADSNRIVTTSVDRTARVWDTTGKQLVAFSLPDNTFVRARFSPDGRRLLTGSWLGGSQLWSATGERLAELRGSAGEAYSFSRDGNLIVTGADNIAILWDSNGREIAVLAGHSDFVLSVAFSPDGSKIITASSDKSARIWPAFTSTQHLVDHLKASMPRCLTPEQRKAIYITNVPPVPQWCIDLKKWPYHNGPIEAAASKP